MTGPSIAVIGGGIAGLAAALGIRDALGEKARIVVVDQADRLGGKLRTRSFAGGYAEAGAETFVTSDPSAVRLAERVGLGDALRHPEPVPAALAIGGALRPIPRGTLMGVPSDPAAVAELAPVADADHDTGTPLLAPGADVSVGSLVRARLGDVVLDRLVDPLLGGVYAGRGDDLSLAVTMPALASACRTSHTLTGAVRAALSARAGSGREGSGREGSGRDGGAGPVFATVEGGLTRLVDAVAASARPELRLGAPLRSLRRNGSRWVLDGGDEVDGVVLALPARPAARLLEHEAPEAAREIGILDYASVALVTFAVRGATLPELSGFLVPASEGYAVKALTIFTTKWRHHARPGGLAVLRASVGRYGDVGALHRSDAELTALVHAELGTLLGHPLPAPETTDVTRWGGALPQYAPGHLDRVSRARAALAPGIVLAGAAYDGVGIPACVRSGGAAAARLLDLLA